MSDVELHPAFAEALRVERESLNQRFTLRQRTGARIDEQAFQQHLRTTVNSLVALIADGHAERVRAVVNAVFDASLDLFAAGLLGPVTKHPHVRDAWREVLPHAAHLLARDPARVVGGLSNGADHVAAHSSGRPAEWIAIMRNVSEKCDSVPHWLDAGKVAAWRAGMVQYRSAALRIARELPWKIAACTVGAIGVTSETGWQQCLGRLETDRWYAPAAVSAHEQLLRIVATTGGFRGFGGPCLRPPTATANQDGLFVSDGEGVWHLLADAFGTCWQRVPSFPASTAALRRDANCGIDVRGRVLWDGAAHVFDELAEPSSLACDGQTLAVTLATSHHVFLLARAADGQESHADSRA